MKWALLLLVLLGCSRAMKRHAAPTTRPRPTTKAAKEPEAHPVPGRWYFPRLTPLQNINAKAGGNVAMYKGFSINLEMNDRGQFVPAVHDPMRHKNDVQMTLPECTADTAADAEYAAQRWLDHSVVGEVEYVWGEAFGKVAAH